jgi:hypothetical protein
MTTRHEQLTEARSYLREQYAFWASHAELAAANHHPELEAAFRSQSELAWGRLEVVTAFADQHPNPDDAPPDSFLAICELMVRYIDSADEVFQLGEEEGYARPTTPRPPRQN